MADRDFINSYANTILRALVGTVIVFLLLFLPHTLFRSLRCHTEEESCCLLYLQCIFREE